MFRVDAHHHLWDLSVRDQPWIDGDDRPIRRTFTVADLAAAAADGVDATVARPDRHRRRTRPRSCSRSRTR